jgi:hypothetical protein
MNANSKYALKITSVLTANGIKDSKDHTPLLECFLRTILQHWRHYVQPLKHHTFQCCSEMSTKNYSSTVILILTQM